MRPYVIDMNARFGGGYPFSHLAGMDLPRAYVAWAEGKEAEPVETRPEKSQALTRLALCVILAVGLYAGAGKLPQLEPWRGWLEGHKIEAIAAAAAVLYGVSLLLFPLPKEGEDGVEPDAGPCAGYEPTEGPL